MLAKHFDKDGDGRLNTAERQAAMKALEQGFEDRFVWGLEQSAGLKDHIRIMQKRGKIVSGENFTVLTETYPVHPLAKEPRRHEDRRDMLRKRKEALVNEMEEEKKLWDDLNPYFIDRKWFKPPGYTENPAHNSVGQLKAAKRLNERIEMGLTAEPLDMKDSSKDPGVQYVTSPETNCQSQLLL